MNASQIIDGRRDVSASRTLELSAEVLLPPVIAEYPPELEPTVAFRTDEQPPLLIKVLFRFVLLLVLTALCDFIKAAAVTFHLLVEIFGGLACLKVGLMA